MVINSDKKQILIWILAFILGGILGCLNISKLNFIFNFIADVFARLFQFVAIPTIALAVISTLSKLGAKKNTGEIFIHAIKYTLFTTFIAAIIGLILYILFTPENISSNLIIQNSNFQNAEKLTYYEHLLSVIPNNIIQPLLSGNILSVILMASAFGLGLSFMKDSENKIALLKVIYGMQELLFTLIQGLIYILPVGIMAFSAQFSCQIIKGNVIGSLGHYVAIVLLGNLIQTFIVIPLLLLSKKINPFFIFKKMFPALSTAFFTKSSAGTLPVTLTTVENNLKVNSKISRFVLPLCTTINMNGCAAFILITSLFVMQNSGFELTVPTMISWVFISVFAAIGNAGVPMGCYFLTASLMSSIGTPLGILGLILPIYTIIDMFETVENVWSDSAVCIAVNKDLSNTVY